MIRYLIILVAIELVYLGVARSFTHTYTGGEVSKELTWTLIRAISLCATFLIFRRVIFDRKPTKFPSDVIWMSGIFLLVPVLIGAWGLYFPLNVTFAATSLVIGLREEFVYRGVLQNLLEKKFGIWISLLLSNLCFVCMHWGSLPFTLWNTFQFAAAGLILGLIYYRTRSIWLVVALHALYDVAWSFTPILPNRLPLEVGFFLLAAICLWLFGSSIKGMRHRG